MQSIPLISPNVIPAGRSKSDKTFEKQVSDKVQNLTTSANLCKIREWVAVVEGEMRTKLKALELFMRLRTRKQQNGLKKSVPSTTNPFEGDLALPRAQATNVHCFACRSALMFETPKIHSRQPQR